MERIAILGAGGFVGSRLVESLLHGERFRPVPIVRGYKSLARLSRTSVEARVGDTNSIEGLAELLKGHPVVVHLAAGDWDRISDDVVQVYRACERARVGLLVHLSSAVVFGRAENPNLHDDSPPDLSHWMLYARQKGAAENFLRQRLDSGVPRVVVLRPGLIWGPRSVWSMLPARQFAAGGAAIAAEGGGVANLIHVDNLVRCILRVLLTDDASAAGFFNVRDREVMTWYKYYAAIADGLGYPRSRLHLSDARSSVVSPAGILDWLKQRRAFYRFMKQALTRLSGNSKSLLKYYLPAVAGGGVMPPAPLDLAVSPVVPKLSRELWNLQTTRHPARSAKFDQTFGDPGLLPFAENMARTVAWLRWAGFGPS